MTTPISIVNLAKHYSEVRAVDDFSLEIQRGELFFILGPSGCGKTTLLRMIAGFIEPNAGAIQFGDRDVTKLAPNKRNTGMVFQSYALWPHMTVHQNVAFGLSIRKIKKIDREKRTIEALRSVHMEPYAHRKPGELSGGQQQRVALARAMVAQPDVLLLDEPLSNLDAKLRLEMRHEIKRICDDTGITTIYVTHDQQEALSMADRVAVMRTGRLEQLGGPRELYDRPTSRFVAEFLGETNFIEAKVVGIEGEVLALETPIGKLRSTGFDRAAPPRQGGVVTCSIRPEAIRLTAGDTGEGANHISGRHVESTYLGGEAQHVIELAGAVRVRVAELNPPRDGHGEACQLSVNPEDVVVLDQ